MMRFYLTTAVEAAPVAPGAAAVVAHADTHGHQKILSQGILRMIAVRAIFTTASLVAALSGTAATAATPITYTSVQTVGTKVAGLSITTDGTLGSLGAANILGWTVTLSNVGESPATASVLYRDAAGAGNNSTLFLSASLSSTATSLTLPFALNPTNHEIGFLPISGFSLFYSAGMGSVFNNSRYGQNINRGGQTFAPVAGDLVLGTVAAPGVPEPGTWAMLLTGFGAVGALTRRRRGGRVVAA